jgi:hypothetical protein
MHSNNQRRSVGPLTSLRALVPRRVVTFTEALRIAELQATRLLELWNIQDGPVPSDVVSALPRIQVVYAKDLPVSGMSHWSGSDWIIALHIYEPRARKRFTLMHEFKHIIDHGYTAKLYAGTDRRTAAEQAEQVADYFAGCVLLPRRLLKRAWGNGVQTPSKLARVFEVSARAADVRLAQVGLSEPRDRCLTALPAGQLFPRWHRSAA